MNLLQVLIIFIFGYGVELSNACTAIGVTGGATDTGMPMVAHTDDAGGETGDVRLVPVPRKYIDHSCNDVDTLCHLGAPVRPVYKFDSGYPRIVTNDRGDYYKPVDHYNGRKVQQSVASPLGYIADVSPQEEIGYDENGSEVLIDLTDELGRHRKHDHYRYAYYDQDYGAMNEVQLSIVESTCDSKTVGWSSDLDYGYNLFGIAELSKVALERCVSARCAIKLMGALAERHGFYSEDSGDPAKPDYSDSAEALILADRYNEVWVFHILTGEGNSSAIWAAQRVKDGEIASVANGFVIREIDFNDNDYFLYSTDIVHTARRLGFFNGKEDDPFDFAKIFGQQDSTPLRALYVGRRIWRIFDTFAKSLNLNSTLGMTGNAVTYPFSVKPDKKITINEVMAILKDHYEGTVYDMTKGMAAGPFGNPNRYGIGRQHHDVKGGFERPISIWRALFSYVCQIDTEGHKGYLWYGPDKPHGTIYFPFATSNVAVDDEFLSGMQSAFDTNSAWRAFNFINNWAMVRYDAISDVIAEKQATVQSTLLDAVKNSKHLPNIRKGIVSDWWSFAWYLVGRFSDGYDINGEGPMISLGYPDWWLANTSYADWPGNSYTPPAEANGPSKNKDVTRTILS